ncbi:MAG TPA: 50S ribosomal protein L13 [Blattabacteriaceae bacterium]
MKTLNFRTILASNKKENNKKEIVVLDANGQCLGRLASKIIKIIRGKHKTNYTPNLNNGYKVMVLNSKKIYLSGNKWKKKCYIRYTGYPGGKKTEPAKFIFERNSKILIERAVKGMLPKGKLGREILRKNLFVFQGEKHKFASQYPKILKDI